MPRLRRLAGQMGISPANCRKVMTAYIQSVAMFRSELWWKGDRIRGTIGQTNELQFLVSQQVCTTTGYFRTTNLGPGPWNRDSDWQQPSRRTGCSISGYGYSAYRRVTR